MIRLDDELAGTGIEGVSKGSETNIAAAVAIRSFGRFGLALNKRSLLRRYGVDRQYWSPSAKVDRRLPIDSL